jgi:Pregnancy-associated plasma protein-A
MMAFLAAAQSASILETAQCMRYVVVVQSKHASVSSVANASFLSRLQQVGHWLGLRHTFHGNSCSGEGDSVSDTPFEAYPAYECNVTRDTCPNDPGFDPVNNYMDYTNDECVSVFTPGQRLRMLATWDTYRRYNSTRSPTRTPTKKPTKKPTAAPKAPTPTLFPTKKPTAAPKVTKFPTKKPTPAPVPVPLLATTSTSITITVRHDNFPQQTSWVFRRGAVTTLGSQAPGSITTAGQVVTRTFSNLSRNVQYTFTITDTDGICCQWGTGQFNITGGTTVLYTGGSFATSQVIKINVR